MNIDDIKAALGPAPRGDKPRKIVVCHPDIYPEVQRAVVHDLGHTDVLVKSNRFLHKNEAVVIDVDEFEKPLYFTGGSPADSPLGSGDPKAGA